jgi:hypothetical protein
VAGDDFDDETPPPLPPLLTEAERRAAAHAVDLALEEHEELRRLRLEVSQLREVAAELAAVKQILRCKNKQISSLRADVRRLELANERLRQGAKDHK